MLQPIISESRKNYYYEKGYWTQDTLLDCWNNTLKKYPNKEYITDSRGTRHSYRDIDEEATKLASFFLRHGIKPGDIVACQIPVWQEFAVVMVACWKVGAVLHPLSISYERDDVLYFLKLHKPKIFVCPTYFHKRDYEFQILSMVSEVPFLKEIILLDNKRMKQKGFLTLHEILEKEESADMERPDAAADDVAVLLCTSGSTGVSKGAMLTHNNIIYAERQFHKELNLNEDDVMFMPSPLNHATGLQHGLIAAMLQGARVVLQEKFQVEDAIFLMNKEKCTYSMGATTFIYDILKALSGTKGSIPSMKFYLCGGAPVPGELVQRAWRYGIKLCEVYGSTESTPHVFVPPENCLEKNGTVSGRPVEGVEVRVVDDNGQEVTDGIEGEEQSRGPNVFVGYTGNVNGCSLDDDGWFHSGDLCVKHSDGFIRITGRKKDIIIRGGENLNANQLDENLSNCPELAEHTVIGMPDSRMGERICAYAVLKPGVENYTLMDLLTRFYEIGIPKWQWPERLELVEKLPKTDSGKIKKYVLLKDIKTKLEQENNQ